MYLDIAGIADSLFQCLLTFRQLLHQQCGRHIIQVYRAVVVEHPCSIHLVFLDFFIILHRLIRHRIQLALVGAIRSLDFGPDILHPLFPLLIPIITFTILYT